MTEQISPSEEDRQSQEEQPKRDAKTACQASTHIGKQMKFLRQNMAVPIDTLFGTGILVFTAGISREQTGEPQYHWSQATDNQAGQPHLLADPTTPLPTDTPPSALDAPEDLERLAAPLLAIERGLPLLSRLLTR